MSEFKLDFQDTQTAFADKTTSELKEKHRLFKMMGSPSLVNFGTKMTNFALSIGLPVSGLIKYTVFEQFCGGETIEECQKTIEKLGRSHIGTILDYSVEGKSEEEDFEHTKDEIILTIKRANEDPNIPFAVFKVSGIAPYGTLEKVSAGVELPEKSKLKWERIQTRVNEICEYAHSLDQPVFIDAEETWIQNAIDLMAERMMEKYNTEKAIVFTTIQLYRADGLVFLKSSHEKAKEKGYVYAVKLVRGAYMEKERARAEEMGYPSPIQPDKSATDRDYDEAVDYCLDNLDSIAFVAGTHNEKSVQLLAQKMEKKKIPHDHPHVFFSQLYGMSDNLSYVLAKNGYNVSKYVPYGPVKDAVPYLTRRAQENTSVQGMMSRELEMIDKELNRRKEA
ncbi:MAG TPA: proline dehydrogenase family protein [Pyrinomonadaceae bacterium]|nr:proline dehydrogenase family protein [Pyrinomonadaceae bacterium]